MTQAHVHTDPRTMLVVEPDRRVRAALGNLLNAVQEGWHTISTSTPAQALAQVGQVAPELALVHVAVPDAEDALAVIGSLSRRGTAVIALGGHDAERDRALASGAAHFLKMSASADDLLAVIRNVTARTTRPAM